MRKRILYKMHLVRVILILTFRAARPILLSGQKQKKVVETGTKREKRAKREVPEQKSS